MPESYNTPSMRLKCYNIVFVLYKEHHCPTLYFTCKDTKNKSSPQHHFFSKRIIMLCIWLIMSKIMLILPKKINIQFIYKNILNTYSLSYFVLCETFCNFAPEKQIL